MLESLLNDVWQLKHPRFAISLITNSCQFTDHDDVIDIQDALGKVDLIVLF